MDRSTTIDGGGAAGTYASFSNYTRPDDHHMVINQVEDSEISIFDAQKYFNDCSSEAKVITNIKPPVVLSTVDVINLQQASNSDSQPRLSSASSVDHQGYGRNYRARSFNATPTASSEASWNSKTGLLSNPPGAMAVSMRNPTTDETKRAGSARKWLFCRKCPCSGKKSVQVVEDKLSETPKTPATHLYNKNETHNPKSIEICSEKSNWMIPNYSHRISACNDQNGFSTSLGQRVILAGSGSVRPHSSDSTGFTFPILNQTSPIKLRLNSPPSPLEDPPRESLEIFQPNDIVSRKSMDRMMMMMPRQQSSLAFPPSSPAKSRLTNITTDDDVASDASSDLFEIESFSTTQTTSYPMYNHRRDSLDEASIFNARRLAAATNNIGGLYCGRSGMMEEEGGAAAATECYYEPSEASIDWSVTTAEGFDRGSVVTNFSDERMMRTSNHDHQQKKNNNDNGGNGGRSKKGNGSLLLSCRCEKAVSVGPNPVKCSVLEKTANNSKPPLARSHSARLSLGRTL
ncbi:hypothetical protein LWI28_011189 [Acer negundo]|uniref:Uncharacterized protein n=1 Tax=Acer negundo TaxID=4023 RepID=A0AAD5I6G8_ACENE|nr:hypothetical protein LWI28_011189 [Acer negundo]KAK4834738.1 hypothetical protein QYF36_027516 [Acer negundo]